MRRTSLKFTTALTAALTLIITAAACTDSKKNSSATTTAQVDDSTPATDPAPTGDNFEFVDFGSDGTV